MPRADKHIGAKRELSIFVTEGRAHARRSSTAMVVGSIAKVAKQVSAATAKRYAQWRQALTDLAQRAVSEMKALDLHTAAVQFHAPPDEMLQCPAHQEVAEVRALARSRGLVPRLDTGRCSTSTLSPADLNTLTVTPLTVGASEATDAWLAEELATRTTEGADAGSDDLLALTESVNRASRGEILLRPNTKTKAQFEKTKFLSTIRTRSEFQKLLSESYLAQPAKNLAPKYLKTRTSYVKQWECFMREGFGATPWRLCWGLDLTVPQIRREENYLLAWFTLNRIRMATFAAAEQAVSHVIQFHITHLDLSPPEFPRLYNRLRIVRHGAKKDDATRKRRPYIKPEYVSAICKVCWEYVQDDAHGISDRIAVCAFWMVVAAGFGLLFRVGELARGAEYTAHRHWCVHDMRILQRLQPGQNACVRQPQRKVSHEHQQEALPVSYWDSPDSFAFAAREKLKLHRRAADTVAHHKLGGATDAFCVDTAGTSPDPAWVGGRLRTLMKVLFPAAAQGMDYTDHTLRRGGATCLSVMNIDPAIQEHAGGWSRNSASRPAYVARVREVLSAAQPAMFQQKYQIMQDDIGFSIKRGSVAQTPPPPPAAFGAAATQLETASPQGLDPDTEREDEIDTEVRKATASALSGAAEGQTRLSELWAADGGLKPLNGMSASTPAPIAAPSARKPEPEPEQIRDRGPDRQQPAKRREPPTQHVAALLTRPQLSVNMAATSADVDPWGIFDKSPGHGVNTSFNNIHAERICTVFQFAGYHPFDDCPHTREEHICSFCRRGSHGCSRCTLGGTARIAQFEANMRTMNDS